MSASLVPRLHSPAFTLPRSPWLHSPAFTLPRSPGSTLQLLLHSVKAGEWSLGTRLGVCYRWDIYCSKVSIILLFVIPLLLRLQLLSIPCSVSLSSFSLFVLLLCGYNMMFGARHLKQYDPQYQLCAVVIRSLRMCPQLGPDQEMMIETISCD